MRSGVRAVLGAWAALAALTVHGAPAFAQSADLVLCDRIAADPNDPDKPADMTGVAVIAKSDIKTAIKFCKSASAHARRAIYQLGRAYAAGGQTGEAIQAYKQAIAKGSSAAMVELGVMYGTGAGVPQDRAQARALFERAAKAGNARAAINLAALGGGTASDPVQSRAIYATAAEGNSPDAQFQLGMMMAEGKGGPKDDTSARAMFEKAAALGNVEAMVWAGAFAELGRGGPQDKERAKSYFSKAAALGNEEAKQRLKNIECPYVLKDKAGKILTHLCP
ncbi:MAG TPA: tetratricopeptide repeat protein [Pseudolabrys sp.]|nr:tetratricopeptide repeat protein [Pseudolabrys sp.]